MLEVNFRIQFKIGELLVHHGHILDLCCKLGHFRYHPLEACFERYHSQNRLRPFVARTFAAYREGVGGGGELPAAVRCSAGPEAGEARLEEQQCSSCC